MHPRQASLITHATEVMERTAAKTKRSEQKQQGAAGGALYMWKYTDPDGKIFYLDEKKLTIKSPFSGKGFTTRPERFTPTQMLKEIKEEGVAEKVASWKAE